jgi:hypothetical protein
MGIQKHKMKIENKCQADADRKRLVEVIVNCYWDGKQTLKRFCREIFMKAQTFMNFQVLSTSKRQILKNFYRQISEKIQTFGKFQSLVLNKKQVFKDFLRQIFSKAQTFKNFLRVIFSKMQILKDYQIFRICQQVGCNSPFLGISQKIITPPPPRET